MTSPGGASVGMDRGVGGRRGQPLAFLAILLLGWGLLRWQVWPRVFVIAPAKPAAAAPLPARTVLVARGSGAPRRDPRGPRPRPRAATVPRRSEPGRALLMNMPAAPPRERPSAVPTGPGAATLVAAPAQPPAPDTPVNSPERPPPLRLARWSADGWVFLRRGATPVTFAAGPAGYGGSQAGAVLRYHWAPASPGRPTAYVRVSAALPTGGLPLRDREAAAGVAVRPVPRVPVSVQAEARLQDGTAGQRVRPAVLAVSEFPSRTLPGGLSGELYAAAGYVGGAGATTFYDAQATVTRPLLRVPGLAALRGGAGAWAGGQRGAHRIDVGPRAELPLRLGRAGARLALDYRVRVAGAAQPGSGPALTLSAGF